MQETKLQGKGGRAIASSVPSLPIFLEVFPRTIRTGCTMRALIGPGLTRHILVVWGMQPSSFVVGQMPRSALTTMKTLVRLIHWTVALTLGIDLLNYMTNGWSRALLFVPLFNPILHLLGVSLPMKRGPQGLWSE